MTIAYWIQLVGAAVVGSLLTLVVQLILQHARHRQDMAGERWKLQFSRLVTLKDTAGNLHEQLFKVLFPVMPPLDDEARRLWLETYESSSALLNE
jgi:hypothetical protein